MPIANAPDLTKRPPRSPRVKLGGFVILPRLLDKGRAVLAGTHGEYMYACPTDQHFLRFAGIDPEDLKKQLAQGLGDGEILAWVQEHSANKPTETQIAAWSALCEQRVPGDTESREFFQGLHSKIARHREDITTWFDLLDLDDYCSYGGEP